MWQKKNQYYAKNGEYTMTNYSHTKSPNKFALWHFSENKGYFATQQEALDKFNQLTKGKT